MVSSVASASRAMGVPGASRMICRRGSCAIGAKPALIRNFACLSNTRCSSSATWSAAGAACELLAWAVTATIGSVFTVLAVFTVFTGLAGLAGVGVRWTLAMGAVTGVGRNVMCGGLIV